MVNAELTITIGEYTSRVSGPSTTAEFSNDKLDFALGLVHMFSFRGSLWIRIEGGNGTPAREYINKAIDEWPNIKRIAKFQKYELHGPVRIRDYNVLVYLVLGAQLVPFIAALDLTVSDSFLSPERQKTLHTLIMQSCVFVLISIMLIWNAVLRDCRLFTRPVIPEIKPTV